MLASILWLQSLFPLTRSLKTYALRWSEEGREVYFPVGTRFCVQFIWGSSLLYGYHQPPSPSTACLSLSLLLGGFVLQAIISPCTRFSPQLFWSLSNFCFIVLGGSIAIPESQEVEKTLFTEVRVSVSEEVRCFFLFSTLFLHN